MSVLYRTDKLNLHKKSFNIMRIDPLTEDKPFGMVVVVVIVLANAMMYAIKYISRPLFTFFVVYGFLGLGWFLCFENRRDLAIASCGVAISLAVLCWLINFAKKTRTMTKT